VLACHNAERVVKDIIKSLLDIVVRDRKEELIRVYPLLPDRVRRLILKYVENVEVNDIGKAVEEVNKEVELVFERVYNALRRLVTQAQQA